MSKENPGINFNPQEALESFLKGSTDKKDIQDTEISPEEKESVELYDELALEMFSEKEKIMHMHMALAKFLKLSIFNPREKGKQLEVESEATKDGTKIANDEQKYSKFLYRMFKEASAPGDEASKIETTPAKDIKELFATMTEDQFMSFLIAIESRISKLYPQASREKKSVLARQAQFAFANLTEEYTKLTDLKRNGNLDVGVDPKAVEQDYKLRIAEAYLSSQTVKALENRIEEKQRELDAIDWTEESTAVAVSQEEYKEIERLKEKLSQEINASPEAFLAYWGKVLQGYKETFDENGRIIETDYVKGVVEQILHAFKNREPVFLHGTLGVGKSELAEYICRKYLGAEPERIYGGRDIDIYQNIAQPKIVYKGRELDEINEYIKEAMSDFEKQNAELLKTDPEKYKSILSTFQDALSDRAKDRVTVENILGPVMKAIQEGKPLIIDEINAIPHYALIVLNRMITAKPGEKISFLDKNIVVKDGFQVIATGNYFPENGVIFVGRQRMDAAFLSRFIKIHYGLLPQNKEKITELNRPGISPEEIRKQLAENEFYHITIARMLDSELGLSLPESKVKETFKKLFELSVCSRIIYDAHMHTEGADKISVINFEGNRASLEESLAENILTVRGVIKIVDAWDRSGRKEPLDNYVFTHYINDSLETRPSEAMALYQVFQQRGIFFRKEEGWSEIGGSASANTDFYNLLISELKAKLEEINTRRRRFGEPYFQDKGEKKEKIVRLSSVQVIKELFGEPPERKRRFLNIEKKESKHKKDALESEIFEGLLTEAKRRTDILARMENELEYFRRLLSEKFHNPYLENTALVPLLEEVDGLETVVKSYKNLLNDFKKSSGESPGELTRLTQEMDKLFLDYRKIATNISSSSV